MLPQLPNYPINEPDTVSNFINNLFRNSFNGYNNSHSNPDYNNYYNGNNQYRHQNNQYYSGNNNYYYPRSSNASRGYRQKHYGLHSSGNGNSSHQRKFQSEGNNKRDKITARRSVSNFDQRRIGAFTNQYQQRDAWQNQEPQKSPAFNISSHAESQFPPISAGVAATKIQSKVTVAADPTPSMQSQVIGSSDNPIILDNECISTIYKPNCFEPSNQILQRINSDSGLSPVCIPEVGTNSLPYQPPGAWIPDVSMISEPNIDIATLQPVPSINSLEPLTDEKLTPNESSEDVKRDCAKISKQVLKDQREQPVSPQGSGICEKKDSHELKLNNSFIMPRNNALAQDFSNFIWQFFQQHKQPEDMYLRKVQLRNALHLVMSYAFENASLFIVGSSMNGFGTLSSDMDLCLTLTARELHQKRESAVILNELMNPFRKCRYIQNLHLIRATVPILKFTDTLANVECDLNVNNVIGVYNTHLLAMYNKVDWRLRPLGMFIKHWALQRGIHGAHRGRLSTYTIVLMLIQYLQAGCNPPVLPSLQSLFPDLFSYNREINQVDMQLNLPWEHIKSANCASLSQLFQGFLEYYSERFDFELMAVSVRCGKPLNIRSAINQLPPHEQLQNVRCFKMFVEEPFSLTNVARSIFDQKVFEGIKNEFKRSLQLLRANRLITVVLSDCNNDQEFQTCSQSISNNSAVTTISRESTRQSSSSLSSDCQIIETIPQNNSRISPITCS